MGTPYAEVVGDPVAHSKSPLIHLFWLERLGLKGDFRPVRLGPGGLGAYLAGRCADPFWRGCSVAAPLKEEAAEAVTDPTGLCRRIGAANAIFRSSLGCGVGANTDLHGIAAALRGGASPIGRACLIGSGGAARAALEYLRLSGAGQVAMIVRDVAAGRRLLHRFGLAGSVHGFDDAVAAIAGADRIVNATPLGMTGRPDMPALLLEAVAESDKAAWVLDMVYAPAETALLRRARSLERRAVDGLAMLVEQAAPAFELFFGTPPPRELDGELREALER